MKVSTSVRMACTLVALVLCGSTLPRTATPAVAKPAAPASRDVIVILRDQHADLPPVRGVRAARAAELANAQQPILTHLHAANASRVRSFSMINAVAARVTDAEAQALAAHPLVLAVVPDRVLTVRRPSIGSGQRAEGAGSTAGSSGEASSELCNTLEPEALQLTHTAYLDPTIPQAQRVRDGNGEFVTGKGVKVAFIADGLDPTLPGFVRPDGSSVFIDYQDFSGDPAGTPTGGGEAFGDASSIAAQDMPNGKLLQFDLSTFVNEAYPLPSHCYIRIRGMAPGASLVGLKVASQLGITTTSNFVQAIEYAVLHDDVDVINESFGSYPFPDNDDDPIALADQAAVAAGVTVVVSTGDAGYNGTLETPSTNAAVISSGATTQYRSYAQANYGAAPFAANGWISGNISAFSSGGFSMSGPHTPDTVAPGDLGWALCSTNTTLFTECTNYATTPAPAPIQQFGGTSESSPLTAGAAALVIQAYRSTHAGVSPTPALVKEILMSTASDLGAPPSEQGAGLINALAAVNAALGTRTGSGLLANPTSASIVDLPRTPETVSVALTNTGSTRQHLVPSLQALGPAFAGKTLTLTLNPATDPTFPNVSGSPRSYITKTFDVPGGAQHLDVAIAYQAPFNGPPEIVYVGLIDPYGRDAAYSIPQGLDSGYGHVDVVQPARGRWTAILWTRAPGLTGSYTGPVKFSWQVERYVTLGSVSPASLDLAPGATEWISARFQMPSESGDQGLAIRFDSPGGVQPAGVQHSDIPIALRTLVPTGPNGGSFTGTLTGGNGRAGAGPAQTFAFNVPPGVHDLSLSLQDKDNLYVLEGLLIDPSGTEVSVEPNFDPNGNSLTAMQLDRANPQPGQWRFIVLVNYYSSGNEISLPFTADIGFDTAQVSARGLPNNPHIKLSASGPPLTVPITITNTGAVAKSYFADARLSGLTSLTFGTFPLCTLNGGTAALTELPYACFGTFLPTHVRSVQFVAQSTAPITMDAANNVGYLVGFTGAPDLYARPIGPDTVAASLTKPEVPWGEWVLFPTLVGPYGAAGAPTTPVATEAVVRLAPFDPAVTSDYGDLWSDVTFGTGSFTTGLLLSPGDSGTIELKITPSPSQVGTTVHGYIYIDTFNGVVQTGDEVYRIPYSYSVVP